MTEETSPRKPPAEAKSNRDRSHVLRVVLTVAAVATLFWLLHRIGWSRVGQAFAQVGWRGAGALMVLGIAENVFDSTSLRAGFRRRVSTAHVVGYSAVGSLVNVMIPWDAGELVKISLLRRELDTQDAVAGTIIWNYLCKLSRPMTGVTASLIGLMWATEVSLSLRATVVAASFLSFLPYLALKWVIYRGAAGSLVRPLVRFHLLSKEGGQRWLDQATSLDSRVHDFYRENPRAYFTMLVHQGLGKLFSFAALALTVYLLGLPFHLGLLCLLYAAVSVATYVYLVLPSRLGVGEVAGASMFALLGLGFDAGLLIQLVLRLKGIVTLAILSLLATLRGGEESRRKNEHAPEPS
jgi:hypothetical protein